jgi:hypothetical protein
MAGSGSAKNVAECNPPLSTAITLQPPWFNAVHAKSKKHCILQRFPHFTMGGNPGKCPVYQGTWPSPTPGMQFAHLNQDKGNYPHVKEEGDKTMNMMTTLKTKLMTLGKRKNKAEDAITFSRADTKASDGKEEKITCCENQGRSLVVATLDSRFTDEMVDYAIEMAQRMDCGIIAVNAANLTHDVTEFFSTSHEELYRDFKETAVQNVQPFRNRAMDLGLKFAHTTKYEDVDQAIQDITDECGQIEFIITENREPVVTRDSAINDNRIAQRLFVYSVE